jgi:Protein of unknown function (DUF3108)
MKSLLMVTLAATALSTSGAAQSPDSTSQTLDSAARHDTVRLVDRFPVGEKLIFDAKYGIVRLGRAELEVVEDDEIRGVPTRHFRFTLSANALGIIRLHDEFDSWVGRDDFVSRRYVQNYNEPQQKKRNEYEIFPDSGYYRQTDIDSVLPLAADPLDEYAFLYFARTLDLTPGARYEFDRYFRPDRNPVVIEVIERDTVEVPAGTFPTVVLHPIIKGGGIFKESADARLWITDDDRRLIVQVQSKFLGIGTITLRLTGTAGVRQPESTDSEPG